MLRLSQKAWNNVLIFSMLALIVLLNYDRLFGGTQEDIQPIVKESDFIVSLQINQLTFERIGTGWRVMAPTEAELPNMQSADIDALIAQWQRALIRPSPDTLPAEITSSPAYLVNVWLAGAKSAKVMGLLEVDNTAYVINDGELYLLDFPTLAQLLPPSP
jgi:hypothetical protein